MFAAGSLTMAYDVIADQQLGQLYELMQAIKNKPDNEGDP
jgi:hypothetical protein